MWIDVLITAGVSVERCVVQEIFEESYMSLSDGPSPRKSKTSPTGKRKGSQEEEKHVSSDEDEPTGLVRRRPASAKVSAPKPSPPAQPERASPKKEKSPSHIAQSTSAVKAKKRRVSERPEEVKKKKNEARPSLTKERRKSSGEGSKKKPKKRPSLSANTSGTTIVLSD